MNMTNIKIGFINRIFYKCIRLTSRNAAFIIEGVAVLCTPNFGASQSGTATGFSLMARSSVKYGTCRRTCFLIRTS